VIEKLAGLDRRRVLEVTPGPAVSLKADADQLEQALINLVKNAIDAVIDGPGGVRLSWSADPRWIEVAIEDDGPGVSDTANLFVPFFTTKSDGSGIGLVLSRQIVEAHGGTLSLASRPTGHGAVARIRLPRQG
jgi:signal transduction histidine kinase